MGQINLGGFGYKVANPSQGAATVANVGETSQAMRQLGNIGMNIGADMIQADLQAQQKIQIEKQQQAKDLTKAKAVNALLDHEIYTKTQAVDIGEKITRGEIPYKEGVKAYQDLLGKAPEFKPDFDDPVLMENFQKGVKRNQFNGMNDVIKAADAAERADYESQFGQSLDRLGKLAGLPGSDVAYINKQADTVRVLGKQAGLKDDVIAKKIQDFKDSNWFNHAQQQVLENQDSEENLIRLQTELTQEKGFYADKLDADKRTALMRSINGNIDRIQNKQQHFEDKREAKAERTMNEIDKQISSTIPATPDQWAAWESTVKGTSQEAEFKARVEGEQEIQGLLRKPLEEQAAYLQKKSEQLATKGGSLREQANLNRLKNAVDENTKLLKENPLLFSQNRTGDEVHPLALDGLASEDGQKMIAQQLKDRFTTVTALRNRYGQQVALNPWLPQESEALKQVIANADENTKLGILSVIAGASPNGASYASAIKAVADDKPITLLAGMAKFRNLRSTEGRDVAKTLLDGDRILADKSVIMPTDAAFKAAFEENIGNALPDGSPQREQAYTAFKALYAGMANDSKVRHANEDKMIADSDLARVAANIATGGVSEYNGSKVIRPYGMPEEKFMDQVNAQLDGIAKNTGYSKDQIEDMPLIAVPGQDGTYYLLNGKKAAIDVKTGKPLMVNIK